MSPWTALSKFLFKALASIAGVFMVRRSGAKAQELKSTKKSLEHARQANETHEYVDGMSSGDLDRELLKHQRK